MYTFKYFVVILYKWKQDIYLVLESTTAGEREKETKQKENKKEYVCMWGVES